MIPTYKGKTWHTVEKLGRIEEIDNFGATPSYNVYRTKSIDKKPLFYKSAYTLEDALRKLKELG